VCLLDLGDAEELGWSLFGWELSGPWGCVLEFLMLSVTRKPQGHQAYGISEEKRVSKMRVVAPHQRKE
jgi:hypothetical protein